VRVRAREIQSYVIMSDSYACTYVDEKCMIANNAYGCGRETLFAWPLEVPRVYVNYCECTCA
jgi:hypothetical protein